MLCYGTIQEAFALAWNALHVLPRIALIRLICCQEALHCSKGNDCCNVDLNLTHNLCAALFRLFVALQDLTTACSLFLSRLSLLQGHVTEARVQAERSIAHEMQQHADQARLAEWAGQIVTPVHDAVHISSNSMSAWFGGIELSSLANSDAPTSLSVQLLEPGLELVEVRVVRHTFPWHMCSQGV